MNKLIKFVVSYEVYILVTLLVLSQFNSCKKSVRVKKLGNEIVDINDKLNQTDSLVDQSFKDGVIVGMDRERDEIYNFIVSTTKKPLDLKSRELIVKITDDIRENKHRD